MPKPASARRVEARRDGGRRRRIFAKKKIPNDIVRNVGIVQEVEQMARDVTSRLRKVDEPVDGFRQFGCSAGPVPQLSGDELRIGRTLTYDSCQRGR